VGKGPGTVGTVVPTRPAPAVYQEPEYSVDPQRLIRIEHYCDEEPTDPSGYARWLARVSTMRGEAITQWASAIVDSETSMDIMARLWFRYKLAPPKGPQLGLHDTRPWRAGTTDTLEENLYIRLGSWRTNVLLVCHLNEEKDEVSGGFVRNPSAPGRLSKRLPAGYSELAYCYATRDEKGSRIYCLQNQNDGRMNATSSINAPDPCFNHYESLWDNWPGQLRPIIHAICYGDPGTGKTTFAATWPCPMLVFAFDNVGKERPYLNQGQVVAQFQDQYGTFVEIVEKAA